MLETNNIQLSPIKQEDIALMFDWINDRDSVIFNSAYKPVHENQHLDWFNDISKKKENSFIFGIRLKNEKKLIGYCQLLNINWIANSAELQIRIGAENNRGKGYGRDAIKLLLKFAFKDINLNRVYLSVFDTNGRAIGAYKKAGFKEEGILREASFIDGNYVSLIIMSILKDEFIG